MRSAAGNPRPEFREEHSKNLGPHAEEKRCAHCKETKSLEEFPKRSQGRPGLSSWCGDCHTEAARRSNERYGDKYRARKRRKYYLETYGFVPSWADDEVEAA